MREDGVITFDQQSEQWKLRQEGVHPEDWRVIEDGTDLVIFWSNGWLEGTARYSPSRGRFYFLNYHETIAIPLARDMMAWCRGGCEGTSERASVRGSRASANPPPSLPPSRRMTTSTNETE